MSGITVMSEDNISVSNTVRIKTIIEAYYDAHYGGVFLNINGVERFYKEVKKSRSKEIHEVNHEFLVNQGYEYLGRLTLYPKEE